MAIIRGEWWLNSDVSIFRIDGDNRIASYLDRATIHKVHWLNFDEARVQIYAPLPKGGNLAFLSNGDLVEVLKKDHGEWNEYIKEQVAIRLTDCQIKRRWICNLSPQSADKQEVVALYTSFTAQIELLL